MSVLYRCLSSRILPAMSGLAITATLAVSPIDQARAQESGPWYSGSPYSNQFRYRRVMRSPRVDDSDAASRKSKRQEAVDKDVKDKTAKSPSGPLFGVISLSDQHVSIYNSDGLVTRSTISTGMAGHRTPTGVFTIIGRERYHRSNIYSGAPMPYMQRLTWSGVAMHLGVVPGYPASHGCVRLPSSFAQQLWGMTKIGERVVISPHEVKPAEFAHALLPTPKMQPSPLAVPTAPPSAPVVSSVDPGAKSGLTQVATAGGGIPVAMSSAAQTPKLLNPIEYARDLKTRAAADAAAAAAVVKEAVSAARTKTLEARSASIALRVAEMARSKAEQKLAGRVKELEAAQTPEAKEAAETAKAAADTELQDAVKAADEAKAVETAGASEAQNAQRAWREATAAVGAAEQTGKDAVRRASPVSILVSKKDMRVYVRQALKPVLVAPAVIRDPSLPLGTHVYIASATLADGPSLRWSVISMPSPTSSAAATATRGSRKASREERAEPLAPAASPAEALERIELPKDVREQISELLWLGGSLIITDQSLSSETSDIGTDLVVTTRY